MVRANQRLSEDGELVISGEPSYLEKVYIQAVTSPHPLVAQTCRELYERTCKRLGIQPKDTTPKLT
jgi:hypothetical protein